MKCGMIPQFFFFTAAFAGLCLRCQTAVTSTPCHRRAKENACGPPVKRDWSSTTRDLIVGQDVTMFCEVNIQNATLTNSTEVEWSVQHNGSFQKNVLVSDDSKTIKAVLTLTNVTKDYRGLYSITFCNMCGSESCITSLNIEDACFYERPDPVQKKVTINVAQDVSTLKLAANFTGATDQTRWLIIWSNSSTSGLGFLGGRYKTRHRVVSQCFFTEELLIHNVSINDGGWYFANVYDSRDTGVNTTFYVNIVNQGGEKKKEMSKLVAFIPVCAVILLAIGGVIGVIVCFRLRLKQKQKHSEPSETGKERPSISNYKLPLVLESHTNNESSVDP